jgi:nitroreductase
MAAVSLAGQAADVAPATPTPGVRDAGDAALALLLARRSDHVLEAPGPSDEELDLILRAALKVPDFQHLRPYRFLAARGNGLARLGRALQRAAVAAGKPEKTVARAPQMPLRAPLVIIAVASPRASKTVPTFDQELSAACTVLTMQLAARALGYGGVWRSGWPMYEAAVQQELGLAAHERIVGYLYLGTPADHEDETRPADNPSDFLTWL